jgi:hypothetical protein
MPLQPHHGVVVTRFERQVTVLRIALQQLRNPVAYGMYECLEFLDVWRLYSVSSDENIDLLIIQCGLGSPNKP